MADSDEILKILKEIRDLLVPISACFEEQFAEIQRERLGTKLKGLEALLTPIRLKICPLLFDPRNLTQTQIAEEANTTQPTVSRFINTLLEHGWIEPDETGAAPYKDKFDLLRFCTKQVEASPQVADQHTRHHRSVKTSHHSNDSGLLGKTTEPCEPTM
jgi:hypothetical protein